MHIYKTRLKVLLRTKSLIFWTLIFPIVLATFFQLAFSNIMGDEQFEAVPVGLVESNEQQHFQTMVKQLASEDSILVPTYYLTKEDANKDLLDGKLSGYYVLDDPIELVIHENGINQTILKSVVDQYYQTVSILEHISQLDSNAVQQQLLASMQLDHNYFKSNSNSSMDITVLYFYSLIGMVCLYGSFFGINAVVETEANMSKKAARISVAPTNKLKTLFFSLLAGFTVQFSIILILLLYLMFVLKIDFGTQIFFVILMTFVGSFAGITMGTLIGVSNRKSENTKIGIGLSVTMLLSFLAGLMMENMKYIIATKAPIIGKINPVTMITDGLYSLYYYHTLDRYFFNIMSLVIFSGIMIILSYFFIRRKKYDSI